MNKPLTRRDYRMVARAEAAAGTAQRIQAAAVALWRTRSLDEITLDEIAERAGVSARTVIRRFGSKEGVIEACIESDAAGIQTDRGQAAVGDVEGALEILMSHYERDGDAVLRTIALEERVAVAKTIATAGRAAHRAWCARVFAPHLPAEGDDSRDGRLDAFVAATDLYLWKLLRRDLDRPLEDVHEAVRTLLEGLIALSPPSEVRFP